MGAHHGGLGGGSQSASNRNAQIHLDPMNTVLVLVQYTQGVIIAESSSPDKWIDSLPFSGFLPISHSEEYRYEYCTAYLHPEIPDSG